MKNFEAAIKDLEHIQEVEPKNKRVKKELLSLRVTYKEHADKSETKKFKKMQIIEEENSSKVQEITDTQQINTDKAKSSDPVIEDEDDDKQKENIHPKSTNIANGHAEPLASKNNEEPIKSEYVKLDIQEDSSEEDEEQTSQPQTEQKAEKASEEIKENKNITEFDKNLMKNEKINEELFDDLEEVEPQPKARSTPKAEPIQKTNEAHAKIEEIDEKVEEVSPEEQKEINLLEEIETNLEHYKQQAKDEHKKGMFDHAIQVYEEALIYIQTKEHLFKHRLSDLIAKR